LIALPCLAAACARSGPASSPVQRAADTLVFPTKGAVTALAFAPDLGWHKGGLYAALDAPGNRTLLYHSADGKTWERYALLDRAGQVYGMVFWNPVEGCILHGSGDAAVLYKVNFGAGNRDLVPAARVSGRFVRLVAEELPGLDGAQPPLLVIGSDAEGRGVVLRTTDGVKLDSVARFAESPPALVAAYARHKGRVFLAGGSGGRGRLYTGAFAEPLTPLPLDDVPNLVALDFDAAGNALAVGSRGECLRSSDGGLTWTASLSGTDADLAAVAFTGDRTAFLCGRSGTLLYTPDAGLTFRPVHLGRREDFFGLVASSGGVHVLGAAGVAPYLTIDNP
jgi:photosystem II stability/assembly factor-like uncharacterized protein